jgi:hypothetical protein
MHPNSHDTVANKLLGALRCLAEAAEISESWADQGTADDLYQLLAEVTRILRSVERRR